MEKIGTGDLKRWRRKSGIDWRQSTTFPKRTTPLMVPAVVGLLIGIGGSIALTDFWPRTSLRFFQPTVSAPTSVSSSQYKLCFTGRGQNCVVDGDTIWKDGVKIRVADIDAPETHPPRCAFEADLGRKATLRLQELLNQGPVDLAAINRDEDIYGRKLRVLSRNGQSLGVQLVQEGLARPWAGSRKPWC